MVNGDREMGHLLREPTASAEDQHPVPRTHVRTLAVNCMACSRVFNALLWPLWIVHSDVHTYMHAMHAHACVCVHTYTHTIN